MNAFDSLLVKLICNLMNFSNPNNVEHPKNQGKKMKAWIMN